MSSFKSLNLFGSGPHRTRMGRRGNLVLGELFFGSPSPVSFDYGLFELELVIAGRLVAGSESALWALRDAVTAQLLDPPTPGVLVDTTGRSWSDMSFILYVEQGPASRGRVWSVAYEATFRRFTFPPPSAMNVRGVTFESPEASAL